MGRYNLEFASCASHIIAERCIWFNGRSLECHFYRSFFFGAVSTVISFVKLASTHKKRDIDVVCQEIMCGGVDSEEIN